MGSTDLRSPSMRITFSQLTAFRTMEIGTEWFHVLIDARTIDLCIHIK